MNKFTFCSFIDTRIITACRKKDWLENVLLDDREMSGMRDKDLGGGEGLLSLGGLGYVPSLWVVRDFFTKTANL